MDLNRIHYFFKAVEYKNFTQAANACHIGQTTMSKYIAVLEQELQTQLFIREHRTLTLTKQGKQFLQTLKFLKALKRNTHIFLFLILILKKMN